MLVKNGKIWYDLFSDGAEYNIRRDTPSVFVSCEIDRIQSENLKKGVTAEETGSYRRDSES